MKIALGSLRTIIKETLLSENGVREFIDPDVQLTRGIKRAIKAMRNASPDGSAWDFF